MVGPAALRRRVARRRSRLPFEVDLVPPPRRGRRPGDVFGVADLVLRGGLDRAGVVVLLPDGPGALARVPGPVVHGVPVGAVPVSRLGDLDAWLDALAAPRGPGAGRFAVLSMWKPSYLEWAQRFAAALRTGHGPRGADVDAWPADEVVRDDVCRRLASGPDLALYVGHGRERGWSAYRGLRWRHVEAHAARRPIGTLMTLTCSNLRWPTDDEPSFGLRWVRSGRACAFVGSVDAVRLRPLVLLSRAATALFAGGGLDDLGGLLRGLDGAVRRAGDEDLTRSWASFRVLGNPVQPF